ncbi:MAG: hypothetical protein DHS20C14_08180 [Phycisphaeraceae bacterium]|nr:MAG: hypothetical protein DHS20C14_08180 [Phycisphaeraceae bacterium]
MAGLLETDRKKNPREASSFKDDELRTLVGQFREELFKIRTQRVSEKVEDNSRFGKLRRDIARLQTELTARSNNGAGA